MTYPLVTLAAGFLTCPLLLRPLRWSAGPKDPPEDGGGRMTPPPASSAGVMAVLGSVAVSLGLALFALPLPPPDLKPLVGPAVGAALVCLLAVADEAGRQRGRHRLLGQAAAAGVVVSSGVLVGGVSLFDARVDLGFLSAPFTAAFLFAAVRSLALLGGAGGQRGAAGIIAALAVGGMASTNGHLLPACVAFALAGSLLGLACLPSPPGGYLGDAGDTLVGLTLGALAVQCSLLGPATVALAAPLAVLLLPAFGEAAGALRRALVPGRIPAPPADTLGERTDRRGAKLAGALCCLAVAAAVGSVAFDNDLIAGICAASVVTTLAAVILGPAEPAPASDWVRPGPARTR